jgi:sugar phosphate isomerase/epimerase
MKFATCNEPWRDVPLETVFTKAANMGYAGVEVAPFTIAEDVRQIPDRRRKEIVRAAGDAGIDIVGLHWLFVSPKGLHLTCPDDAVRRASVDYLKALTDFCADLGGQVMIFGSPKQRNVEPPTTFNEAWKRAREVFAACADHCTSRGVTLCIEALSTKETNFINTAEEAARMADEIGSPGVDIMLDMKAMSAMPDGVVGTIRRFGARAKHVHANEACGKGVGMPLNEQEGPAVELKEALAALATVGYKGWVSVEPFDYSPDPDTVAHAELQALKAALP